jgi:hypothetical protein
VRAELQRTSASLTSWQDRAITLSVECDWMSRRVAELEEILRAYKSREEVRSLLVLALAVACRAARRVRSKSHSE